MNHRFSEPERPFCSDPAAARLFDSWSKQLTAMGLELGPADRRLVGVVASREAVLEGLRARVVAAEPSLRLVEVELKAANAYQRALVWLETTLGVRVEAEAEVGGAQAVGAGGGRVLAMVPRPAPDEPRAVRGQGQAAVEARILACLGRKSPLRKDELRAVVKAAPVAFLAALRRLVGSGRVRREGQGKRGQAFRYHRA